jgi:thiol-disulfide isomerase/thioredoxin
MKFKKLTIYLLVIFTIFFINSSAYAQEKVNVYLFWGDGCSHCENAKKYFSELNKELENKFELYTFEVWYNENNSDLLFKVGETINKEIVGVPFIIIGDETFFGYNSSMDAEIKATIESQYNKGKLEDIVASIIKEDNYKREKEEASEIKEELTNEETDETKESSKAATVIDNIAITVISLIIILVIYYNLLKAKNSE